MNHLIASLVGLVGCKRVSMRSVVLCLLCFFLNACYSSHSAPVENIKNERVPSGYYRVQRGDTLYLIAWTNGLDFRYLAALNHISSDYTIHPGQRLRLRGVIKKQRTAYHVLRRVDVKKNKYHLAKVHHWHWPARGRIVQGFAEGALANVGVDIGGQLGEPVRASAAGVVVYSGAGVRGYGNLIIIKHNNNYLSAYAYNKSLLVKLGQQVKAQQQIATMGQDDAGKVLLHFEIRRNGQPVDPVKLLKG